MATRRTTAQPTVALLLLRIVGGGLLLVHGLQKLFVSTPEGFTAFVASQGLPVPGLLAWLLIIGEIVLGTLLVLGLLTRVAGALAALMMALVWVSQHAVTLPDAVALVDGSTGVPGENALLLVAVTAALALAGPGAASLDQARGRGRRRAR